MRILILEDDFLTALDIKSIVESAINADIVICASVRSAKANLAERFDFAFLDVDVTDGKSFELAERLLEARTPFVFVSGSTADALPSALKGAQFVAKPFTQQTLLGIIEARASSRAPSHEHLAAQAS
jgi:DNA-binding LytR/AlgR family response regulator